MPGILAFVPEIALFLMALLMNTQIWAIGTILAVGIVGLFGLLLIWRPITTVETALRWWPLMLVGILAVVSTFWSTVPWASFRYGAQLLLTIFVGVHVARLISPERFVSTLFWAFLVFCIMSVVSGRQGPSAEGMVLIGLTGSKNQMGFAACYLALTALAVLLLPRNGAITRVMALVSFPLSIFLLFEANSLTALLMALGGCFLMMCLWISQRLPPGGRVGVLVLALMVSSPFAMAIPEIQHAFNYLLFDVFEKDPTLTGRTILWERADALLAQRPVAGWGYQAIWMGDSSDTIGLQRLSGQDDGRSFHFHNQFRQIGVDMGWIGIIAFSFAMLVTAVAAFRQAILMPTPATSFFAVIFFSNLARAFTDMVLSPFSFSAVIFFAACVYAYRRTVQSETHGAPLHAYPPGMRTDRLRPAVRGWRRS